MKYTLCRQASVIPVQNFHKPTDWILFKQHDKSSPHSSTHYVVLYSQNGDRTVAIDSVTSSLGPMYNMRMFNVSSESMSCVCWTRWWALQKRLNRSMAHLGYGPSLVHIGAIWWMHLKEPCAAMRSCIKLLWPPVVIIAGFVPPCERDISCLPKE